MTQGRLFSHRVIENSRSDILSTVNIKKCFDGIGNAVVTLGFRPIQVSDLNITIPLTLLGPLEIFLKFTLKQKVSTLYTFNVILFFLTSDHLYSGSKDRMPVCSWSALCDSRVHLLLQFLKKSIKISSLYFLIRLHHADQSTINGKLA